MQCKNCCKEVNDQFKFCNFCGKPIIKEVVCKNCGEKLPEGSKFCGVCGRSLEQTCTHQEAKEQGRLRGYDPANGAYYSGWVNEYNGWVYLFEKKYHTSNLWKMQEDGKNRSKIYEANGQYLNINKHGIFFIEEGAIVHLDLNGNFINKFTPPCFNGWSIFVYDDTIYLGDEDTDNAIVYVSSCKIDGSDFKTLATLPCDENREISCDCLVNRISSNGKKVIFYAYGEEGNITGWYQVDVTGQGLKKIEYKYQEIDEDREMQSYSLEIFYIDVEKDLVYTSLTNKEQEHYGLNWGDGIIKRPLGGVFNYSSIGELSTKINPYYYTDNDFSGYYSSRGYIYFNGEVSYGFVFRHEGVHKENQDYYYNLYKLNQTGQSIFLNAGSRGGIEELVIAGEYAYFDQELALRVKLDGSDFEDMRPLFKLFG